MIYIKKEPPRAGTRSGSIQGLSTENNYKIIISHPVENASPVSQKGGVTSYERMDACVCFDWRLLVCLAVVSAAGRYREKGDAEGCLKLRKSA